MRLHYLVKLKIRVFLKILMTEKQNSKNILLIDFDFTYLKRCNCLTLTSRYDKFNLESNYVANCQNWPRFVKDMTKHFCVFFGSEF